MRVIRLIVLTVLLLLSACAPEPRIEFVAAQATGTPRRWPEATPEPVSERPDGSPLAQTPASEPGRCPSSVSPVATSYAVDATLNWLEHTVEVTQHVEFTNQSARPLDFLVLNVEPARSAGGFELRRITDAGQQDIEGASLEAAQLKVPLREPLLPACMTGVALEYSLTIPAIQKGYRPGHLGYWGYSERQVNLGLWLPLVAPLDENGEWITPAAHEVGEHYALGLGNFAITLRVIGAPEDTIVAGPGFVEQVDQNAWRFELGAAREIAFSVSPHFATLTSIASSGLVVELYYLERRRPETLDAARWALGVAADSAALFERLYGPLPVRRLIVVEGDFPDGMEFSGLVYVSEAWFRTWKGLPNDWLTIITAHEVAHQWWYGLVGNDQARYPYLDESLATYNEYVFLEHYFPEYTEWWWDFRVGVELPTGFVDQPVYSFRSVRQYINAIYLRGAMMLHALRFSLGDDVFLNWLQAYAQQMSGCLATPQDFWAALPDDQYVLTQEVRGEFLANPAVVPARDSIP